MLKGNHSYNRNNSCFQFFNQQFVINFSIKITALENKLKMK